MSFMPNSNASVAYAYAQRGAGGLFVNPMLFGQNFGAYVPAAGFPLSRAAYIPYVPIRAPMVNGGYNMLNSMMPGIGIVPPWGYMQNIYGWTGYHNSFPQGYVGNYHKADRPGQELPKAASVFEFNPRAVEFVPRPRPQARTLNPQALEFVPLPKVARLNPTAPEFLPSPAKKVVKLDPTVPEFILHKAPKLDPTTPEFVPCAPVVRKVLSTITEESWDCDEFMDLLESCESFEDLQVRSQPDEFISSLSPHALEFTPRLLGDSGDDCAGSMSKSSASLENREPESPQNPLMIHTPSQDYIESPLLGFEFYPFSRSSHFEYYDPSLEPEWSVRPGTASLVPAQELTSDVTSSKFGPWIQALAILVVLVLLKSVFRNT